MARFLTDDEVAELWERYSRGETSSALARRFGKSSGSMSLRIQASGGIRPTIPRRAARHLTLEDREEISRGLASGHSYRQIGRLLRRPASTISREVAANGGRSRYRATHADRAAVKRRRRPKVCKLAASPRLAELVEAKLEQKWSPEQIDGWLKLTYPDDAELQVSHETIYRSLFIQSRGASNASSPATYVPVDRPAGLATAIVNVPRARGTWSGWSTSVSVPLRLPTGRFPATGRAI